jgi:hypothetical protein
MPSPLPVSAIDVATASTPHFSQNLFSEKITGRPAGPATAGKDDFEFIQRRQPFVLR